MATKKIVACRRAVLTAEFDASSSSTFYWRVTFKSAPIIYVVTLSTSASPSLDHALKLTNISFDATSYSCPDEESFLVYSQDREDQGLGGYPVPVEQNVPYFDIVAPLVVRDVAGKEYLQLVVESRKVEELEPPEGTTGLYKLCSKFVKYAGVAYLDLESLTSESPNIRWLHTIEKDGACPTAYDVGLTKCFSEDFGVNFLLAERAES